MAQICSWILNYAMWNITAYCKMASSDGSHCIFGQLISGKIITTVATRCQILRLKCTKFYFGWGSAPDPAEGAYSASPDHLAGFKGAYF